MKRALIADDSRMARMFVRQCLQIAGLRDWEFKEANHGEEALVMLKAEPFDLLVTDLNMPVLDGARLLKHVRASPKLVDLPVLVVTSAGNPAREKELVLAGAFAVLCKPVSPATMARTLAPLLSTGGEST
jgi:two-component system chemotaxis response regulator CheY